MERWSKEMQENKKVSILLETSQKAEGERDQNRIECQGTLYVKEGSTHILYEEQGTKTHIRISGDTAHIHRLGELSGDLWFVQGDRRDTRYETPYGRMILTLDTHKLDWDPKQMRLYIRYNILTEDQLISMNEMTIKMKELNEQ
jgi:uncharacterized beta-barrel protein YwiB (DUF1934 family)